MTQSNEAAVAVASKEQSAYAKRLQDAGMAEVMVQIPIALHDALNVRAQRDGDVAKSTIVRRAFLAYVRDGSAEDNYGLDAAFVLEEGSKARKSNGAAKSAEDAKFDTRKERNVSQLALQAYKARKLGDVAKAQVFEAQIAAFEAATNEQELVAAGAKPARERKNGAVVVTQAE